MTHRRLVQLGLVMVVLLVSACSAPRTNLLAVAPQPDAKQRYAHLYADLNTGQYNKPVFNWMSR